MPKLGILCHLWHLYWHSERHVWIGWGDEGPFSLQSFLAYHLRPNTWADELIIMALSIMWQVKIIIVAGHDRKCSKVRLKGTLKQADMIFLHTENKHFSTIGKSLGDEWKSFNPNFMVAQRWVKAFIDVVNVISMVKWMVNGRWVNSCCYISYGHSHMTQSHSHMYFQFAMRTVQMQCCKFYPWKNPLHITGN